jgi:hypothetical protein
MFRGVTEYPHLNAAGHVTFNGWLSGPDVTAANDNGIWSDVSGSLSLVVRAGDHAPGTPSGVAFQEISDTNVFFNGSGKIAFAAGLTGAGADATNSYGIWSNRSGAFGPVMREGDSAPGVNGKVFGSFGNVFFNDAGQVAFRGYLSDPGVVSNWSSSAIDGLWGQDNAGNLHLIVLKGGQIEVTPGDVRTVKSFDYVDSSFDNLNGDGSSLAFNGRGQFAFHADFTDGSSGIFVSDVATIPEPGCLALLTLGMFTISSRRRRS